MTARTLDRIRRLTRDEVSWRTRQAGRIAAQRMSARVRPPKWKREDVRSVLAESVFDQIQQAGDSDPSWDAIHTELMRVVRGRTSRFVLDPSAALTLRDRVLAQWPAAAANAAARADAIVAGRYDLLGYRALPFGSPDGGIDWHLDPAHGLRAPLLFWADVPYLDPSLGDHKVIWELNRHQHWLQLGRAQWLTGDSRYRDAVLDQLESWLTANPPLVGINWASMLEIGLRAISWVWAMHFLLGAGDRGLGTGGTGEPPWLVDMLVGLDRQLGHVEQNLSLYFSPNTHLTGEALGLYVVGVALPELASSRRWAETGRDILLTEIDRQINADGGHAERSTHYQRYTLDFYLMALLTAERDADDEAVARFSEAVARLAEFTQAVADDEGRLPLIGDDDGGMLWPIAGRACNDVRDSLALAAGLLDRPDLAPWGIQEEVLWTAGGRVLDRTSSTPASPGAAAMRSRTFPETGYVVLRDGSGDHAVFDVGPHGYMNAGHAHADALALTLTLAGTPVLIDPGTSTYTVDSALRDRLRSSLSHNTVTLGGRSQAVPAGPFHWETRADARLHAHRHNAGFDWVEASHDGYAPLQHRRTLIRTAGGGWLIADEILGEGPIRADAHWHFDPEWVLSSDAPGRLTARHFKGDAAWLLHDAGDVLLVHGDENGLGWYAPVYGALIPTWTARTTRDAVGPFTMLSWIGRQRSESLVAPSLERLQLSCDTAASAIGARVIDGCRVLVFMARPGEPAVRDDRACGVLEYQTNARVLHYVEDAGRLVMLDLVDATHALALRDGWITVAASDPIADLHIAMSMRGVIDLHASAPPAQLRLQGGAIDGLQRLRLNDREVPVPHASSGDTVVIHGSDWNAGSFRRPEGLRILLPVSNPPPTQPSIT